KIKRRSNPERAKYAGVISAVARSAWIFRAWRLAVIFRAVGSTLILRFRLLAAADAGGLNLHELDQRVHVLLRQVESGHANLFVLLEERCCDRIFLLNQFVRLGNDAVEPG